MKLKNALAVLTSFTMLFSVQGLVTKANQQEAIGDSVGSSTLYSGDFNGDGKISTADLILTKKYLLGADITVNYYPFDVNNDGKTTTAELIYLKKVLLGIIPPITIGQSDDITTTTTVTTITTTDTTTTTTEPVLTGLTTNQDGSLSYYDQNGQLVSGWVTVGEDFYYFDDTTFKAVKGIHQIDGNNYYFNRDTAVLMHNCIVGEWVIDATGIANSLLKTKANMVLSSCNTPDQIYSYMRSYHRYKHISDGITLNFSATNDTVTKQIVDYNPSVSSVNATGWSCFALYTINNSSASCYYLASLQDYLFRQAGYTSRIVYGTQGSGVHYWNQVLVGDAWLNYDACNSGRGAKSNDQLLAINGNYIWCGYIVPDQDYNGCYYYDSLEDYDDDNYTYLVDSVYYY